MFKRYLTFRLDDWARECVLELSAFAMLWSLMFHFRVSPYINEQTVSIGFILSMDAIVLSKLVSDTMLTISKIASFSSSDHCLPML